MAVTDSSQAAVASAAGDESSFRDASSRCHPLRELYADSHSGARLLKRSRRGKCRYVFMRITVDGKGTQLCWRSTFNLRRKTFNLSTLCEVSELPNPGSADAPLIVRLRNLDRPLDFVVESANVSHFTAFFNDFRR